MFGITDRQSSDESLENRESGTPSNLTVMEIDVSTKETISRRMTEEEIATRQRDADYLNALAEQQIEKDIRQVEERAVLVNTDVDELIGRIERASDLDQMKELLIETLKLTRSVGVAVGAGEIEQKPPVDPVDETGNEGGR